MRSNNVFSMLFKKHLGELFFMIMYYVALQIILESFPISSSTHGFFFFSQDMVSKNFLELLHAPTVLVLLIYACNRWYNLIPRPLAIPFIQKNLILIFLANSVTCAAYIVFALMGTSWFSIKLGLIITTMLLLSSRVAPQKSQEITFFKALIIGFVQGLALLPGISRLGSTFVVGRWLGLSSRDSLIFSCALQIPLFAAGALKGFVGCLLYDDCVQLDLSIMAIILMSMIIAYYCFALTEYLMLHNKTWYFGIYMFFPLLWVILLL